MVVLYVLALLCVDDKVLLLRRSNASFGQGLYSLVGGKVENNERALHALQREIREEIALDIPEDAFKLVHTFHRNGTDNNLIALCFIADISAMPMPKNNEPNKHDDMQFFKISELPSNIIPAHKQAIEYIQQQIGYSEHGW